MENKNSIHTHVESVVNFKDGDVGHVGVNATGGANGSNPVETKSNVEVPANTTASGGSWETTISADNGVSHPSVTDSGVFPDGSLERAKRSIPDLPESSSSEHSDTQSSRPDVVTFRVQFVDKSHSDFLPLYYKDGWTVSDLSEVPVGSSDPKGKHAYIVEAVWNDPHHLPTSAELSPREMRELTQSPDKAEELVERLWDDRAVGDGQFWIDKYTQADGTEDTSMGGGNPAEPVSTGSGDGDTDHPTFAVRLVGTDPPIQGKAISCGRGMSTI